MAGRAETTPTVVSRGQLVEAMNGRLVVMTAGPENVHGPLTHYHGLRAGFAFFFSCNTAKSKAHWDD